MQIISTRLHRGSGQIGVVFEGEKEILLPWRLDVASHEAREHELAIAAFDERSIRYIASQFDADEFEVQQAVEAYKRRFGTHTEGNRR